MKVLLIIKKWFKDQLIKNKIIAVYIPLIIIPLFLLGYISNYFFTQAIIEKTIKNVLDDSNLIITRIDTIITNTESCANITSLDLNRNVYKTTDRAQVSITDLELRNQIQNQLSFSMLIFKDVESIAFIDKDSNIYFPSDKIAFNKLENHLDKAVRSSIFEESKNASGQNFWFPMQRRDYLTLDEKTPVLTLGKLIININTGKKLGTLVLNIEEDSLSSIYKNIGPVKRRDYYIIDNQGRIISSMNKEMILKTVEDKSLLEKIMSNETLIEIRTVKGKKMLVTSIAYERMGWKLVNEIPLEELTKDTRKTTFIIVLIGLICLIFALLGAGTLSRVIANPLVKLTKTMSKIKEGNLDVNYNVDSRDEIGLLAAGFNTMIKRINDLLISIKAEQRKKREYELALIQAQIKPHFLYNTLDVIYTLSKMGREKEAQKATKSLADFYRAALSKGKEVVSIGEEIKNVTAYLSIQRIRYSDVFDFEISVDEEILQHEILKLTIQPLVENSIYHGLKAKGSPGKITVEGYKDGDKVVIKVIDDGVGIAGEKINELLKPDRTGHTQPDSFGLISVDERIRLYFGDEYGIRVNSKVGSGTEVIILIPA